MHILEQSELNGMPCPDTLIHGDCLAAMKHIADGSVSAIICDLPFGTTSCAWDSVIPFTPLWEAYKRIIKPNGAIVLFGVQPFTSALVMSNPKMFKYEWVWQKSRPGSPMNAKARPLKEHENIAVFSRAGASSHRLSQQMVYNPQGLIPTLSSHRNPARKHSSTIGPRPSHAPSSVYKQEQTGYPRTVLRFASETGIHPTQKPVALLEYLIRTYSNPGDLILDNTMGSATLPVACLNTGRHFIGIEKDDAYFAAGCARVRAREIELASVLQF